MGLCTGPEEFSPGESRCSDPASARCDNRWGSAPYHPTPTIIEAARALYARHTVEAISRNDAGAKNLGITSRAVEDIIEETHATRKKVIVFVTGVPGAGKTLVGLNVATRRRHADWAVIVCLVGGGQEIHTGEAGIAAWLDAARKTFPHWQVYVSPDLTGSEYAAANALDAFPDDTQLIRDERLHLFTSMRSFRSEKVSAFVKAVLDCELDAARKLLRDVNARYPIALTRDLARAKRWIRSHARGSERYGLVASSQAQRLKPHAIDIRVNVDPIHWFLNDRNDTRSSYYLEDAATEFQIQGLELDWTCVNWDADMRFDGHGWRYHSFRGDGWTTIHKEDRKRYLLNAYRVLLTRARQGMVIFVPPGDELDPTRNAKYYDDTYMYLSELGIGPA